MLSRAVSATWDRTVVYTIVLCSENGTVAGQMSLMLTEYLEEDAIVI
jgi:hypothetical protein